MKGYIKISDILKHCEKVVAIHEELIQKALDKDGPISNVSAVAYFMQQQRVYKYDIPGLVDELGVPRGGEFIKFCDSICSHRENKQIEPHRWKSMEPCNNCPAEHFAEYLENQ